MVLHTKVRRKGGSGGHSYSRFPESDFPSCVVPSNVPYSVLTKRIKLGATLEPQDTVLYVNLTEEGRDED